MVQGCDLSHFSKTGNLCSPSGFPAVAESFTNRPQPLHFRGQRGGGGVRGVCLTVTQRSRDPGGLWVAEWSTERMTLPSPLPLPPTARGHSHVIVWGITLPSRQSRTEVSEGKHTVKPCCSRQQLSSLLGLLPPRRVEVFSFLFSQPSLCRLCFSNE